jgi:hypothetical protein
VDTLFWLMLFVHAVRRSSSSDQGASELDLKIDLIVKFGVMLPIFTGRRYRKRPLSADGPLLWALRGKLAKNIVSTMVVQTTIVAV